MLQTKVEKDEMLKQLLKINVFVTWFTVLFFGFIVSVLWMSAIADFAIKDIDTGSLIFESVFSLFITGVYIYTLICFIIENIKIKRCIKNNTYIYKYVPINNYQGRRSGLYAEYWYNGESREVSSATHKAKMVHVFDCSGVIVAKAEEEKDLAM